jgi:hypothetical protein
MRTVGFMPTWLVLETFGEFLAGGVSPAVRFSEKQQKLVESFQLKTQGNGGQ